MSMPMPLHKNNRGSVLITAIIIMTFLALLGAALIGMVWTYQTDITVKLDRLKARYLAEAGIACAIHEIRFGRDPDKDGLGNIRLKDFAGGEFWAKHDFQSSTITATGRFNDIERTIQISYASI